MTAHALGKRRAFAALRAALAADGIVVDMSTITPQAVRTMAVALITTGST